MERSSTEHRELTAAIIIVGVACATLAARAVPLLDDGTRDLRTVKLAMHDEWLILERTWRMVDAGDFRNRVRVYPGLYPNVVAFIRVLLGPDHSVAVHVACVRVLSLLATLVALLLPFFFLLRLERASLAAALFTAFVALHPETVLWAARVHPDALLLLFNHTSLVCFALAIATGQRRYLLWATALAGLSAGTKLVGFFIMVCIAAWILWQERGDQRRLLGQLSLHAGLFVAVLVATTPMLLWDLDDVVRGWILQNRRNRHTGSGRETWLGVITGVRGLGATGTLALALAGLRAAVGGLLPRRAGGRWPLSAHLLPFVGFGLFFLTYLVMTVELALPRYVIPALWPLSLAAFFLLRPSAARLPRVVWPLVLGLLVVFTCHDLPARWRSTSADQARYDASMTPEVRQLARTLRTLVRRRGGAVLTHYAIYVPADLDWVPAWTFEERMVGEGSAINVVVVSPQLEWKRGEETPAGSLAHLGFSLASTVGESKVYVREVRAGASVDARAGN